ncbi:hypothetical protein BHM03_00013065 [Ensete ventricosum]|nr:hypothetical protein BHM03_00013065 [Ensete ventricosum]
MATDGLGHALAKKLSSNSLASLLKDKTKDDLSRSHHIRVEPRRVVGNAQHIKALEVPYRAIWARNEMTCSTESEPPS